MKKGKTAEHCVTCGRQLPRQAYKRECATCIKANKQARKERTA